jgi:hypothetical protein
VFIEQTKAESDGFLKYQFQRPIPFCVLLYHRATIFAAGSSDNNLPFLTKVAI